MANQKSSGPANNAADAVCYDPTKKEVIASSGAARTAPEASQAFDAALGESIANKTNPPPGGPNYDKLKTLAPFVEKTCDPRDRRGGVGIPLNKSGQQIVEDSLQSRGVLPKPPGM